MSRQKFDGVIEAAHCRNGQIIWVRAYERRGATFSDTVLLDRKDLLQRLQEGKRFVTGRRSPHLASTFSPGKLVKLIDIDGRQVVSTRDGLTHDELEDVPLV